MTRCGDSLAATVQVERSAGSHTVVVTLGGRITRAAAPELCERVLGILQDGAADLVVCDVGGLIEPDVAAVDALARIELAARRHGRQVRLQGVSVELRELFALAGLTGVLDLQ